MPTITLPRVVFLVCCTLLTATGSAQKGGDELTRAYERWLRDFVAGRIDPQDKNALREPYLTPALRAKINSQLGGYDRVREAEDLFRLLEERGTREDGERLVEVIAASLKRKGGRLTDLFGDAARFRDTVVEVLAEGACPPSVQAAVVDRVRAGIVAPAGQLGDPEASDEGGKTRFPLQHKEPDLTSVLAPLLGAFGQPSFRTTLEELLRVDDAGVRSAAASALGRLGYGLSVGAVARALRHTERPDDVAVLSRSLELLAESKRPAPDEKQLVYALGIVLERLQSLASWRARLPLVPVVRKIRGRASLPVLIGLLEQGDAALARGGKDSEVWSGTLLDSLHKALVDLSGYYAGPREPEKWRSWWASVQGEFDLAPVREAKRDGAGTVAQGFFGIPVTGSRVLFVVDVSGSMKWPYDTVTAAGTAAPGKESPRTESRIDRAKKELVKALEGIGPDSKFNVVFFSDHVKTWKDALVPATPGNKKALEAHLKTVDANGGTMLFDGLDTAMKVKTERKDNAYGSSVDEIFLLSDGSPTLGTVTNTQEILDLVATWNRGAQVRINAIYIGDEEVDKRWAPPNTIQRLAGNMPSEEFMTKLAEQNHGQVVFPNGRRRAAEPAKR